MTFQEGPYRVEPRARLEKIHFRNLADIFPLPCSYPWYVAQKVQEVQGWAKMVPGSEKVPPGWCQGLFWTSLLLYKMCMIFGHLNLPVLSRYLSEGFNPFKCGGVSTLEEREIERERGNCYRPFLLFLFHFPFDTFIYDSDNLQICQFWCRQRFFLSLLF